MQNRYTGDIGDFGKYGFLKAISSPESRQKLSLGVVWYLVPDEEDNEDGSHTKYLNGREEFRNCDPNLYDALRRIVNGKRNVAKIRENKILPRGTIYYEKALTFSDLPSYGKSAKERRLKRRKRWLKGALDKTEGQDIVFLDPDNGLEVKSEKRHHKKGPKYVFYDEVAPFIDRGQSAIIYQHLNREPGVSAEGQIQRRKSDIDEIVNGSPFALWYRRRSGRFFLVAPIKEQEKELRERAREFLKSDWSRHFDDDLK